MSAQHAMEFNPKWAAHPPPGTALQLSRSASPRQAASQPRLVPARGVTTPPPFCSPQPAGKPSKPGGAACGQDLSWFNLDSPTSGWSVPGAESEGGGHSWGGHEPEAGREAAPWHLSTRQCPSRIPAKHIHRHISPGELQWRERPGAAPPSLHPLDGSGTVQWGRAFLPGSAPCTLWLVSFCPSPWISSVLDAAPVRCSAASLGQHLGLKEPPALLGGL